MKRTLVCLGLGLMTVTLLLGGCGPRPIVVASTIESGVEGAILAQLIIQVLEGNGYEVIGRTWMGKIEDVRKAIRSGDIDIYPGYTGTELELLVDKEKDREDWKGYTADEVVGEFNEIDKRVTWLTPAPANNPWCIAINSDVAEEMEKEIEREEGQKREVTIEDFVTRILEKEDDNNVLLYNVLFYGSEPFFNSDLALKRFETVYDFKVARDRKVVVSSPTYAEHLVAFLDSEPDTVHVAMAYATDRYLEDAADGTTNGYLERLPVRILADNWEAQFPYHPAPVVRSAVLKRLKDEGAILRELFQMLTTETLQELNARAVDKLPREVAREFLEQNLEVLIKEEVVPNPEAKETEDPEAGETEDPEAKETEDLSLPQPPADLFKPKEDERSIGIVNARITVPAGRIWQTDFYVDDRFMCDVRVVGWFMVESGGAFKDVKIAILNDIDFANWKSFRETKAAVYLSEKVNTDQIERQITDYGSYHLVFSNRFSEFSYKYVIARVYLYYKHNCGQVSCDQFRADSHRSGEFEVEVGDKVRVELCSDPTKGFEWTYKTEGDTVLREEDRDFVEAEDEGVVGAAGKDLWTFEAIEKGKTEVSMEYSQPGEGGIKAKWTYTMTVTVK